MLLANCWQQTGLDYGLMAIRIVKNSVRRPRCIILSGTAHLNSSEQQNGLRMGWTATSTATALVVTFFTSLVFLFPGYYKLWAAIALFGGIFAFMLLRNPAYRYMRLACWITTVWATATAVPEFKAAFQVRDEVSGTFGFGNQLSWAFHLAFAVSVLGCLAFDYFASRENSALRLIIGRIHVRFGGQSQSVTGGTAIQFGDVSGQATVNLHQTDVNRELDHAKALLEKGMPDAAEEHLLRIKQDHESSLTVQQQFRLQAYFGKVFHDRGESSKSAVHYRHASRLRPKNEDGRAYDVFADFMEGSIGTAYEKAVQVLSEYPASSLATAIMIRSAPQDLRASILATRVHESIKDEVDVLAALATRYLLENDTVNAEEISRRIFAKCPDHPAVTGRLGTAIAHGEAYAANKRFWEGPIGEETKRKLEEAISLLTKAINSSKAPGDVRRFRGMRGVAREILGSLVEAETDYVEAYESDRTDQEAAIRYASFLGRKGRHHDALNVLRPACNKEVVIEFALMFANLSLEIGTVEDKQSAVACLRRGIGKLSEKLQQQRDDAFRLLSELTEETAGLAAALAIQDEFSNLPLSDTVRAMVEASLHMKAGDTESANETATLAINALQDNAPLSLRLHLAQLLEKLKRFPDVVAILRPVATSDNFIFVGKQALSAAHQCGADDFILVYARSLREAGRWDPIAVELEIETLRRYREYDQAISVCREFIERAPNERDRRFTRLRLSLIGVESGQLEVIERNPTLLPQIDEVDAHIGRILCAVLERGLAPHLAVETAYELVRRNNTSHEAHLALCAAVGIGRQERIPLPEPETIAAGAAVKIKIDAEASPRWLVIEDGLKPDPTRQEYAPTHRLCVELIGKKKGDRFVDRANPYQELNGVVEEVTSKFAYRAMDSLTRWTELFPNKFFAIRYIIETRDGENPDFSPILRTFEAQEQNEASLRKWYRDHPVSLLMLSIASKRHPSSLIQYMACHQDLPIRCCAGNLEEFEAGRRSTESGKLVADPSALSTLFVTNLWQGISQLSFKLVVTLSSINEFRKLAEEQKQSSEMRLAAQEGELILLTNTQAESNEFAVAYEKFVEWVKSVAEVRSGIALASIPRVRRDELISLYGQAAAESIATAIQDQLPLWTDDATVPVVMQQGKPVLRTWTQLVAERLRAEGCISEDQFAELLARLIGLGYQHTQCVPEALLRAALLSDWNPNHRPLKDLLDWLGNENINEDGVLGVAVGGLRQIWRNAVFFHQRESVTRSIGQALSSRPNGKILVQGVAASTDRMFPLEPHFAEQCRNILNHSIGSADANRLLLP